MGPNGTPGRALKDDLALTRECCERALCSEELRRAARALEAGGVSRAEAVSLVRAVTEDAATVAPLSAVKRRITHEDSTPNSAGLERLLLVYAALDTLPKLPALPVGDDVKRLFCDEFRFFASAPETSAARFEAGTASFTAMCKTATLRRFRAGQFDWEVSTVSRSYVLSVGPSRLPAVLAFVVLHMRGLGPVFFSHLAARRESQSLLEEEANRSYYRMACAMELQPQIKGFAACSWFRSPATHRVSPHLRWLSRVFEENGGLVAESGYADPHSGVLSRSRTRQRLFESGQFRPTRGLVLWPRDAMIAWARSHPQFGEDAVDR